MRVEFADDDFERLLYDAKFRTRLPPEVVKMYRKRMQYILQATDERDFRAMKSFHYEKLLGNREGQHSIRLNRQFRIVFRIDGTKEDKKIVILTIGDYHQP